MIKWLKRYGVAGSTEIVQIRDGRGQPYTGGEVGWTFLCRVWPGDNRTVTSTLPAVWDTYTLGMVQVSFPLATMQALSVGFYSWELARADVSLDLAVGTLEITAGPGIDNATPKAYHTYQDLVDELPWVGELRDYLRDQSGFAEASRGAYDWINAAILQAVPVGSANFISRQNYWWWSTPSAASGSTYPPLGEDTVIAGYLTAGKLITTTATGKRFVSASVFYTLGTILGRAVGMNTNQNINALASQYTKMAHDILSKCVAEIDTNADGIAEFVIPLSMTNTRFG
jgi:hypothetical protein